MNSTLIFFFLNIGYNLRLSDPQAAVGCVQLAKLHTFVKKRTLVAERYKENISKLPKLEENLKFPKVLDKGVSSWFGFSGTIQILFKRRSKKMRKNYWTLILRLGLFLQVISHCGRLIRSLTTCDLTHLRMLNYVIKMHSHFLAIKIYQCKMWIKFVQLLIRFFNKVLINDSKSIYYRYYWDGRVTSP